MVYDRELEYWWGSGDEFCRRTDEAFIGLPFLSKIVDDAMVQADSIAQLGDFLRQTLLRCREHGIRLSKGKFVLGSEIPMAGFLIGTHGVKPDPAKMSALREFPRPKTVQELQGFLGLANQFGFFFPNLTQLTQPLRALLKKDTAFTWTAEHEEAFDASRRFLTSDVIVKPFDPALPTELLTDASKLWGLGFVLIQREPSGVPRLVQCGSRSLNSAEKNYAAEELECLAATWAIA